jgi:hypothetical protein
MTPWLLDAVGTFMLVVAAVSAARLVAARPWQHGSVVIDTDSAHLLMAIAMAGMLAPRLSTLPAPAWEVNVQAANATVYIIGSVLMPR